MQNQRWSRIRLRVEELEPRVVLSANSGVVPALVHSIAVTSTNWAGYAGEANLNSFNPDINTVTAVSASWNVPSVTGAGTAYSSVWVGIDGYDYHSGTVEQIGTESDLINGQPQYYAWYEMYPGDTVNITKLTIRAGDSVTAAVTYNGGANSYLLKLTDNTTKGVFSVAQTLAGAQRSSAEWIVEAPSSDYGILPLANFGSVTLTGASATIGGTAGPIDRTANASINLVGSRSAAQALTTPTAPFDTTVGSATTSSFTVKYMAPAAPPPSSSKHHHYWQTNSASAPQNDFVIDLAIPQPAFQQALNSGFGSVNNFLGAATPAFLTSHTYQRAAVPISWQAFFQSGGGSNAEAAVGNDEGNLAVPERIVPLQPMRLEPAPAAQPIPRQEIPSPAPRPIQQQMPSRYDDSPVRVEVTNYAPVARLEVAEIRSGGPLKTLISLLGGIGAFCLYHGGSLIRSRPSDEREQLERDRPPLKR